MTDILTRIVELKRAEVEQDKARIPPRRMIEMASASGPPHDFVKAIERPGRVNVIAEVKRASPSKGGIQETADPAEVARAYAAGGAAAISVLTDSRFFLGAPEHLTAASQAVQVPVLRKDFIFDEYQVYQSRALGADSVLLIARILEPKLLATLIGVARSLHMEALVEIHAGDEVAKVVDCGARLVGVNNRDLGTFQVSIDTSLRIAPLLPEGIVRVSESGIETREHIERLRESGYHAFLIGERLMREADPGAVLRELVGEEQA